MRAFVQIRSLCDPLCLITMTTASPHHKLYQVNFTIVYYGSFKWRLLVLGNKSYSHLLNNDDRTKCT